MCNSGRFSEEFAKKEDSIQGSQQVIELLERTIHICQRPWMQSEKPRPGAIDRGGVMSELL
jgi:hypothetical protein